MSLGKQSKSYTIKAVIPIIDMFPGSMVSLKSDMSYNYKYHCIRSPLLHLFLLAQPPPSPHSFFIGRP